MTAGRSRINNVSTHSRPKAAGDKEFYMRRAQFSFNTQPPEGGWMTCCMICAWNNLFQHTAARRRLVNANYGTGDDEVFQHTAARRRLGPNNQNYQLMGLFQHTAARRRLAKDKTPLTVGDNVSTHSRPKAAGGIGCHRRGCYGVSTHSRPKAAGPNAVNASMRIMPFQHTAARRRLAAVRLFWRLRQTVSTHSRPKAAGRRD